jgi:hypothetical protein
VEGCVGGCGDVLWILTTVGLNFIADYNMLLVYCIISEKNRPDFKENMSNEFFGQDHASIETGEDAPLEKPL